MYPSELMQNSKTEADRSELSAVSSKNGELIIMSFAGLFFLFAFLPAALLLYYVGRKPMWRNTVLLLVSFVFYAWGKPVMLLLLLGMAIINWVLAGLAAANRGRVQAKLWLALALVLDIGLLLGYKYTGFFLSSWNGLFGSALPVPSPVLPLGISFYTFELISYQLDVFWGKIPAERRLPRFLLYISFFATVTSGPIVRYGDLSPQLGERHITVEALSDGLVRLTTGLAKKVIIADMLGTVVKELFSGEIAAVSVVGCWAGIILFALQMYFDFSGYSDMAIGIGLLFGFRLKENFDYPFCCRSISEFWQRWHISLGSFFRDYLLYVPFFGRRTKYFGLFLVWFCTGLWHGASWNFVIWGLYFGVFVFLETLLGKKRMKKIPVLVRHLYTKLVIAIGFGIFYFESLPALGSMLRGLVGLNGNAFANEPVWQSLSANVFLIAAAILFSMPIIPRLRALAARASGTTVLYYAVQTPVLCGLLFCSVVLLTNATRHPFLYARF